MDTKIHGNRRMATTTMIRTERKRTRTRSGKRISTTTTTTTNTTTTTTAKRFQSCMTFVATFTPSVLIIIFVFTTIHCSNKSPSSLQQHGISKRWSTFVVNAFLLVSSRRQNQQQQQQQRIGGTVRNHHHDGVRVVRRRSGMTQSVHQLHRSSWRMMMMSNTIDDDDDDDDLFSYNNDWNNNSNNNNATHYETPQYDPNSSSKHDAATADATAAEPLQLSNDDRRRIYDFQQRQRQRRQRSTNNNVVIIPIVLLDALLPGQTLYFTTSDPKFESLLKYLSQIEDEDYVVTSRTQQQQQRCIPQVVGIVGFDPNTGDPMRMGVTSTVRPTSSQVQWGLNRNNERVMVTSFKGRQMFEIIGEPWIEPTTQSFFLAHVKILDHHHHRYDEIIPEQHFMETQRLFVELPNLIYQWMVAVIDADLATPAALQQQIKSCQLDHDLIAALHRTIVEEDTPTYSSSIINNREPMSSSSSSSCSASDAATSWNAPLDVPVTVINSNSSPSTATGRPTLPTTARERAIWVVAALLNPTTQQQGGCYKKSSTHGFIGQRVICSQDLRPAMLACQNDFDRLLLATAALRRSISSCRRYKEEEEQQQ